MHLDLDTRVTVHGAKRYSMYGTLMHSTESGTADAAEAKPPS